MCAYQPPPPSPSSSPLHLNSPPPVIDTEVVAGSVATATTATARARHDSAIQYQCSNGEDGATAAGSHDGDGYRAMVGGDDGEPSRLDRARLVAAELAAPEQDGPAFASIPACATAMYELVDPIPPPTPPPSFPIASAGCSPLSRKCDCRFLERCRLCQFEVRL